MLNTLFWNLLQEAMTLLLKKILSEFRLISAGLLPVYANFSNAGG